MKHASGLLALTFALGALASSPAISAPASSFDTGAEGWQVVDFSCCNTYVAPVDVFAPVWQAGGYIEFTDPSSGSFYFSAPTGFLGDLGAYAGGSLRFTQQVAAPDGFGAWRDDPDVVIVSGGRALVWRGDANPGSSWTPQQVTLSASGWHFDSLGGATLSETAFASALGSVSALYIRGEYVNGVVEKTGLDAVQISAVPEPATALMMLAGLGVLATRRRR